VSRRAVVGFAGLAMVALAFGIGRFFVGSLAFSPADVARIFAAQSYGWRSLRSVEVLGEEPLGGDRAVVFRALNTRLPPSQQGPRPTAIVLGMRPHGLTWEMIGGGAIGTVATLDEGWAVSCAWTWLRFATGEPTLAAFYELERVDAAVQRAGVAGRRAVVFPYAWEMAARWPAQQPRAIRLYDVAGAPLALPTSPVAGGAA
jgi:hypothetical protein